MWFKRLTAFIFALYPILWIYQSPISFVYGDLLLFLLALYGIFRFRYIDKGLSIFYLLWGYIAITNIFNSSGNLSVTTLIPGGITFFVFAVSYIFLCKGTDYSKYVKYYKIIAFASVVFWAIQEVMYYTIGTRVSGLIPFLNIAGDVKTSSLISAQQVLSRSSSFFREPAHFIQFLLPILCIDLFGKKNTERFASVFSWILIACMLLSRSGNALIGLSIVLTTKGFYLLRKKGKRFSYALFLIPLAFLGTYYYMVSEIGGEMLSRFEEFEDENSSGYLRVIRGFIVFGDMPSINQWLGASNAELETLISRMGSIILIGNANADMYFNGIQNILLHHGYVGMLLYLLFFVGIYKKTTPTGRALIWLMLVMSLIGNIYLTYCMMICMVVSTMEIRNNKEYEKNRILYQKGIS